MAVFQGDKVSQLAALRAEQARRRGAYPLSHAQLRLWLLDRADPGNPAYNVSRAFQIEGSLDVRAFERSLGAIVERHASLRTSFHFAGGETMQVVRQSALPALEIVDLCGLPAEAHPSERERLVTGEASHRFQLSADPLLRTVLIRAGSADHTLIFTLHHIIVDERSLEILFTELRTNYAAFVTGGTPSLAPLQMQFAEFAVWERTQSASAGTRAQLDFWKTQLAGLSPTTALPYARSRPALSRFAGGSQSISLAPERVAALRALARDAGATPFMAYLCAFYTLLHRYSGAEDLVVGTPISGRRRREAEDLIGFFANAVALRLDLRGDPSFVELLGRVKAVSLDAFAHHDVPFEQVVASVMKERHGSANPIFQVAFAMQPGTESLALTGTAVTPLQAPRTVAKFDLTALVFERGEDARFELNYDTDLFDDATIAAMLAAFHTICDTIAVAPQTTLRVLCPNAAPAAPLRALAPAKLHEADRAEEHSGRRELEAQFQEQWETLLDVRTIGIQDDFFELGGNSLLAVRFVERIEKDFGVRLPLGVFFDAPTIERVAEAVLSRPPQVPLTPLQPIVRGTLQPPVVFFHGDLSGASFYPRTIAKHLGDRTVYALPPHGFDGGDVPKTIEAMAAQRIELLRHEGILPPYDLIGYCNGALVALEVARQLAASGTPPPRVFAIEAEVDRPHARRLTTLIEKCGVPLGLDERARSVLALRLLFRWNQFAQVSSPSKLALFAAGQARAIWLKLLRRSSISVAEDVPARNLVPIYRERFLRYRPGPYAGRVTVLCAGDQRPLHGDPTAGWSKISPSAAFYSIEGDHTSSITTQGVALAHQLRKCLDD